VNRVSAYIVAGDRLFYTHPRSGVLFVQSGFNGRDGSYPSRISPDMRTSMRGELPLARAPAVTPFSAATGSSPGSHLWVG